MRILNSTFLLLVIGFLTLASSCTQPNFEKDMVHMDKRFIPVLYYTFQNDMKQAEIAMIDFEIAWSEFDQRYQHRFKDEYWKASFDLVDNWIEEVKYFIHQKDAANSLAVLQQIRYQLNDARSTHHIDYWLDEVWNLEDAIELSLEVATDAMLCKNQQVVLNELKGEVDYHWQTIETSNIDMELFEFDNNEISNLIYREKQLNKALVFMGNSIDEKECEQISIAAKQLEQSYFEYLAVFGEFRTISDAIAFQ